MILLDEKNKLLVVFMSLSVDVNGHSRTIEIDDEDIVDKVQTYS